MRNHSVRNVQNILFFIFLLFFYDILVLFTRFSDRFRQFYCLFQRILLLNNSDLLARPNILHISLDINLLKEMSMLLLPISQDIQVCSIHFDLFCRIYLFLYEQNFRRYKYLKLSKLIESTRLHWNFMKDIVAYQICNDVSQYLLYFDIDHWKIMIIIFDKGQRKRNHLVV